jgi:hypothetical protein
MAIGRCARIKENIMRKISYNLLIAVSLMILVGSVTAFANKDTKTKKIPKNMGALAVSTLPEAYPVKVDGNVVGMSSTDKANPAEFYLSPGVHQMEIQMPDGKNYTREVNINAGQRNCICIKRVNKKIEKACPYDVRVDSPSEVTEGDLVTFAAQNAVVGGTAAALTYLWKVSPSNAKITSGQGTDSITIDTSGLGDETVIAELDVTSGDQWVDTSCRQRTIAETRVKKMTPPPPIDPLRIDEFDSRSFDDDKARLDNFAIELQNRPDAQGYIIVYQGTGKKALDAEKLARRSLNYLSREKGVDPRRLSTTAGGTRTKTGYEFWIIPAGAGYPSPTPR